ncbi:hypothetical protein GCM10025331_38460 [Actinoplanes utahensis]|nr:hypothetical protein Aut01nite_45210 [Actinoplanes utahensis]
MAALDLVDAKGEFTLGEVAAALAVRPSSLYNHISSKADIVEAMRTLVFTTHPPAGADPPITDGWQGVLRALLRRYRDAFGHHPRLIPMLTAHTVSSPDVVHMYDDIATVLAPPASRPRTCWT